MYVSPLIAPACDAFIIVSLKGFAPSLFPFSDIGGHQAAAPKMALFSSLCFWFCRPITFVATKFLWPGFKSNERRRAIGTRTYLTSAITPSKFKIALRGTIFGVSIFQRTCWAIKRIATINALAFLAVLLPIERLARFPLIPRCFHIHNVAWIKIALKRIKDDCPMFAEVAAE
jgi:hypothetical protein